MRLPLKQLALASLCAIAPGLLITQADPPQMARDANPDLTAPKDVSPRATLKRFDCDKPKLKNGERPLYTVEQYKAMMQPELSVAGVSVGQTLTTDGETNEKTGWPTGDVTFKFTTVIDNTGHCDADASRMKAILKLAGGRWLAEDRVDTAVKRLSNTTVTFEMTVPFDDLLVDCALNRSDWVLTTHADFRNAVSERDETNNTHTKTFTTASGNICPKTAED